MFSRRFIVTYRQHRTVVRGEPSHGISLIHNVQWFCCAEDFVKFEHVIPEICMRTDRHAHLTTLCSSTRGGVKRQKSTVPNKFKTAHGRYLGKLKNFDIAAVYWPILTKVCMVMRPDPWILEIAKFYRLMISIDRGAPPCKIVSKWSIFCGDVTIFKMAAIRHLGFIWGVLVPPTTPPTKSTWWSLSLCKFGYDWCSSFNKNCNSAGK